MQKNMEVREKNNSVLVDNPFMSQILFTICSLFTDDYEGEVHDEIKNIVKDRNSRLDAYIDIAVYSIGAMLNISEQCKKYDLEYILSSNRKQFKIPKDKKRDIFNRVIEWNKSRNLHKKPLNVVLQVGFILEEIFEFFDVEDGRNKAIVYSIRYTDLNKHPMIVYDKFALVLNLALKGIGSYSRNETFGKFIFNKMSIVLDANDKKGSSVDKEGKIIKDSTFIEPELGV